MYSQIPPVLARVCIHGTQSMHAMPILVHNNDDAPHPNVLWELFCVCMCSACTAEQNLIRI